MKLRTNRLEFVPLGEQYAENFLELWNDEETIRYTDATLLYTVQEVKDKIAGWLKGEENKEHTYHFVILRQGEVIGIIGIPVICMTDGKFGLYYELIKRFWHKGYAKEAVEIVINYIFRQLNAKMILADAIPANIASVKILEGVGFKTIGYTRKGFEENGNVHDIIHFQFTNGQYLDINKDLNKGKDLCNSEGIFKIKNRVLETERTMLRRFKTSDVQDLYEYLSDEDVVRFEPYDVQTIDEVQEEAQRRVEDGKFWAVCLKENGKVIGNVYFAKQDFDTWELGYVFNKKYQGQGYATESARRLIEYGIENWGIRRIVAMCSPLNIPSWKVMEKLGMRREGHLLQNIYFKRDEKGQPIWLDTYQYGLLASEVKES